MGFFKHDKAIVADGATIGDDTRIWAFANVQDKAVIGSNCNICDGCFIENGSSIGNNVTLKNQVCVFEGITLENNVFVGANTTFINDRFPRSKMDNWHLEKIVVRKGATIGANATILCGIEIGEHAFIGAGSVVTKDVPAHTLVVGNPAVSKGYRCECAQKLDDQFKCASCGKQYALEGGELKLV